MGLLRSITFGHTCGTIVLLQSLGALGLRRQKSELEFKPLKPIVKEVKSFAAWEADLMPFLKIAKHGF